MNITMQGKYQTRDGRAVRILATDFKAGATYVIGAITMTDTNEIVGLWNARGEEFGGFDHLDDLIPVPTKHEVWVIVPDGSKFIDSSFYSHDEAYELTVGDKTHHMAKLTWES
jgi:hypothetical protein